jgi:hypothetical protein
MDEHLKPQSVYKYMAPVYDYNFLHSVISRAFVIAQVFHTKYL